MASKCLNHFPTNTCCGFAEYAGLRSLDHPRVYHLRLRNSLRGSRQTQLSWYGFHRKFSATSIQTEQFQDGSRRPSQTEKQVLDKELGKTTTLLRTNTVPDEGPVLSVLQTCEDLARSLANVKTPQSPPPPPKITPTSNLLSLEAHAAQTPPPEEASTIAHHEIIDRISDTAYKIITDRKVFITPKILSAYVSTQLLLRRLQSLPHVFDLYASKPIPEPGSSPIKYKDPNPNSIKAAVPLNLAHAALNAAIEAEDLPLCFNIITTTVATTAYKRAKFVRRALLPMTALATTPLASYALASALAQLQDKIDPHVATMAGTAGFIAYISFTSTIGYVAITTANDQMDRITWAMGTPLRERWTREEERAFLDRVAGAWGFENVEKRGEEEGEDWEFLREWVMQRGMILDNPALMEGME